MSSASRLSPSGPFTEAEFSDLRLTVPAVSDNQQDAIVVTITPAHPLRPVVAVGDAVVITPRPSTLPGPSAPPPANAFYGVGYVLPGTPPDVVLRIPVFAAGGGVSNTPNVSFSLQALKSLG